MKHVVPDWLVQLVWFLAGVYGTGALWYFLSRDDHLSAIFSLAGAALLTLVAVQLHRINDRTTRLKTHRECLAAFMKEAEVLLTRSNEDPLPMESHDDWVGRVEAYLKEQLDVSYAARLGNFSGMTFYGDGSQKSNYKNAINGRTTRLQQFITELGA